MRALAVLGLLVLAALLASGIRPYDRTTWFLEVFPVLIVALILLARHHDRQIEARMAWARRTVL